MRLSFQKRIISFLFVSENHSLVFLCISICLTSLLAPDHFFACIIILLVYILIFLCTLEYIKNKDRIVFTVLFLLILIHCFSLHISSQKAKKAMELERLYLDLFVKEELFMTKDGSKQVIFEDNQGKRYAIWLSKDQANIKNICGYFTVNLPEKSRNPGAFDQREYLKSHNCYAEIKISSEHNYNIKNKRKGLSLNRYILYEKLEKWLLEYFDDQATAFILSFAFGQKQYLTKELKIAFDTLGMRHLLAVSGFHLDLFLLPFSKSFTLKKKKPIQGLFFLLPFIFIYNWFCNFPVGLLRASLVYVLYALCLALKEVVSRKNILYLVTIIWLMINPFQIFQIGFQLSFLSSYLIYLTFPYLLKIKTLKESKVLLNLSLSLIIQICIMPFLLKNFGSWQLATILFNSILVFPFSLLYLLCIFIFLQFASIIMLGFVLSEPLLGFSAWIIENSLSLLSSLATSSLWAFLKNGRFDLFTWILLLVVGLILSNYFFKIMICFLQKRFKFTFKIEEFLLTTLFLVICIGIVVKPLNCWRVYFLDVGQGDSCLIISPDNKSLLIDGGIRGKGHQIIIPAMEELGLNSIDHAIISHFDEDHHGGIIDLIEIGKIEQVFVPKIHNNNNQSIENLAESINFLCEKNSIPLIELAKNDFLILDSIGLESVILAPDIEKFYLQKESNAYSLCFVLNIEGLSMLFTGDLTLESERNLIIDQVISDIDILKVAHHGSKYGSSDIFIEKSQPQYAVISVGNNRYGHPSEEVLDRLDRYQVLVKRTDMHGAIMLELKNKQWLLSSFLE